MTTELPALSPVLVLIGGAFVLPLLSGHLQRLGRLVIPLLALMLISALPDGAAARIEFLGYTLTPVRLDALSRLFAVVFALVASAGALFALHQPRTLELSAAFLYAGSALGAVLAGDLISLFVFWELMAIGSTLVILSAGNGAERAAFRYAVMHLLGGVLLMAGIAGEIQTTGSPAFSAMDTGSVWRWLILAGFLINAAAPPVSAWLPDAYPESSWSGMVFLSAFTTKTAVYVLLRGFPGNELLIWIGLFMAFYGIVYAVLENDMRRLLAYSIVNQVGIMLVAVGIGTEMALNGAAAQAFVHIIYKALILMALGSVLLTTGKRKCSDLGGLARTMPLTCLSAIVGALSITSFPLTASFTTKSLITQSAADQHLAIVWLALAAVSAGTVVHAAVTWFVFFGRDSGLRPAEPPANMRAAMLLLAAACVGIGLMPGWLYAMLPYETDYAPYTASHVLFQLQLVLFSGLAFFLLLGMLKRTPAITLDTDWLWRRAGSAVLRALDEGSGKAWQSLVKAALAAGRRLAEALQSVHGPEGLFGRTWPTGTMAFWATLMLGAYLFLAYL
jgi:multicomponent Na+:H+ antiporter subunit D